MVLPLPHRSEYIEFGGAFKSALLQGADDFRLGAAQEGIGGLFHCDRRWQGDPVGGTQFLGDGDALLHGGIIRFTGQRKAQIGGGIFVGAIDTGGVGQAGKALQ